MLEDQQNFVSTAEACLEAMAQEIDLAHGEGLSEERLQNLSEQLESLMRGAAHADARALVMAGEHYADVLTSARTHPAALARIVRCQFEIRKLLAMFAGGVADISPKATTAVRRPDASSAARTLKPLIQFCETEDQKSALHTLIRFGQGETLGEDAEERLVRLDTVFAPFSTWVLSEARQHGKKVSLSYCDEAAEVTAPQARLCKSLMSELLEARLGRAIESPDMRRVAGKSETARIQLSASQTPGGAKILLSDDGDYSDHDSWARQVEALNSLLSIRGLTVSLQGGDEFLCEVTIRRGGQSSRGESGQVAI